MAITFSTLEELEEFYDRFELKSERPRRAKRVQTTETESVVPVASAEVTEAPRRGRKKAEPSSSAKPAVKAPVKRARPEVTLTSRVEKVIDQKFGNKQAFTANDVYDFLSKKDKEIKKQSVITSVLKQMTTNPKFKGTKSENRPGKGPRPVKLYIPTGAKA